MEITVLYAVVLIVGKEVFLANAEALPTTTADEKEPPTNSDIDDLKNQVGSLEKIVQSMARQLMAQQFSEEERVRSDGFSGLKLIRCFTFIIKPLKRQSRLQQTTFLNIFSLFFRENKT